MAISRSIKNSVRHWTGRLSREFREPESTIKSLQIQASNESALFLEPYLGTASVFSSSKNLHEWIATRVLPDAPKGLFLEFGFHDGISAKRLVSGVLSNDPSSKLHAFDAFQGLRDAWSWVNYTQGSLNLGGVIPKTPYGVELVVGWVEDTLVPWMDSHPGRISFVHFDMDVFAPTHYALSLLLERMNSGSLILFDELHGYPGWKHHEFKALNLSLREGDYEYVAFGPEQALIRII